MPTTYTTADQGVCDLLADVMRGHHPPLYDACVRVGVLFAANEKGPAVKAGGYPAFACMRVVSLKDRVTKAIDAELVLDRDEWGRLSPASQRALLDHELSHIALADYRYAPVLDAAGEPTGEVRILFERDDLGRPKLATVRGDFNAGDAFGAVIRRHGRAAVEFLNAKRFGEYAERALLGDG